MRKLCHPIGIHFVGFIHDHLVYDRKRDGSLVLLIGFLISCLNSSLSMSHAPMDEGP